MPRLSKIIFPNSFQVKRNLLPHNRKNCSIPRLSEFFMKTPLQTVALRQQAVYVPDSEQAALNDQNQNDTFMLLAELNVLGFTLSENALKRLHTCSYDFKISILEQLREVMGVKKNWTPLVKGWGVPTGESFVDHLITFFANVFKTDGVKLACGHIIPPKTFPLERYNGCPFCGTPFVYEALKLQGQGTKKTVLELWGDKEIDACFVDLLTAKTPLDATQRDSLSLLIAERSLPKVTVGMKETLMLVITALVHAGKQDEAAACFQTPTDVLRYLWYQKTGYVQLIEPKTIIQRHAANHKHVWKNENLAAATDKKAALKLKYDRKTSRIVAGWLNQLVGDAEKAAEIMHPKREMWVRFIRALRLPEYAKRPGFEALKYFLDVFYNEKYAVWAGKVAQARIKADKEQAFALLKQRPGLFARALFATMLWFGTDETISAFEEIAEKVPARLLFTLSMYAPLYFTPQGHRTVKGLGAVAKHIPNNPLVNLLEEEEIRHILSRVEEVCLNVVRRRFRAQENSHKSIYIAKELYYMPVAIGDRSENVQDMPVALMGTRFPVEGNSVRLFMQWGMGLKAQHLDMDLSCHLAFEDGSSEVCSYFNLVAVGSKHSGDIRAIPDDVGTAEYIELNLDELRAAGVKYATFTCNAYSYGNLTLELVVGWMNSANKMEISEKTGVAYDPSCVQHQVKITQNLTKGLVFGVLDVTKGEIVWLEMPFQGQTIQNMNVMGVAALLAKLSAKLNVGNLLKIKAEAQGLTLMDTPEADEVYTAEWAKNSAAVSQLLLD